MRFLLLAALASLLAGCAAKTAAPPAENSPLLGATSSPVTSTSRPSMWAVRVFDEKPQWLASHAALAKSEPGMWGDAMQLAVEQALDAKGVDARSLPSGVTDEQMKALFQQGLSYLVEGTMAELAAGDVDGQKGATLKVGYRLKRRLGSDTRVVQARTLTASTKSATVDEAALRALLPLVAEKIADAVIADVPADLLAIRG